MTEAELVAAVLELCADMKILVHHCRDSRHCSGDPGFPDLVLIGLDEMIFRECKSAEAETTAEQDLWAHAFRGLDDANCSPKLYAIWRPDDLQNGKIKAELLALG